MYVFKRQLYRNYFAVNISNFVAHAPRRCPCHPPYIYLVVEHFSRIFDDFWLLVRSWSDIREFEGLPFEIVKILLEKHVFASLTSLEHSGSIRNHLQSTHNLSWTFQNNHQFVQLTLVLKLC